MDWLTAHPVDVLCLQEIKLPDEQFPHTVFAAAGYRSIFSGQKTYNGVAILARTTTPLDEMDIVRNIPGFNDPQQRLIAATLADVRAICAYFPNGQAPGTESSHINSSGSMRYMIGSRKRWRVIQNSRCWEITTSHLRQQTCAIRACGKRGICFHRMSARPLPVCARWV